MKRSTFGVIVGTRGFFNPVLAKEGRESVLERLKENGFSYVALTESDTRNGCVETREDAQKCAELFRKNANKIDGIIITLPNFGDEIAATESGRFSYMHLTTKWIIWIASIVGMHFAARFLSAAT